MISITESGERLKIHVITQTPDGRSGRNYIGHISKIDHVGSDEIVDKLSDADKDYLLEIIQIYRRAESVKLQATALNLPSTLQLIVKYFETDATEAERRLILQSLEDTRRSLRKMVEANT